MYFNVTKATGRLLVMAMYRVVCKQHDTNVCQHKFESHHKKLYCRPWDLIKMREHKSKSLAYSLYDQKIFPVCVDIHSTAIIATSDMLQSCEVFFITYQAFRYIFRKYKNFLFL